MSGRVRVSNLKPFTASFNTVTTSTAAGTYTQLPSVVCDEVVFTAVPTTSGVPVIAAYSSSPTAGHILYVANVSSAALGPVTVPTGPTRNANALYLTNESGTTGLIISFMCLVYDSNSMAGFPNTAPGAQA
jgi:hypothetical protein